MKSTFTLIDALLTEQRELTAVEEFAVVHQRNEFSQPRYRSLIPSGTPGSGEQFAFEVDLDQCSGCKACVTACHSLNGLDENETWRSVGGLTSTDWRAPLQQFVTTACHHCLDPACLNGCPVLAYHKDPLTGIVRHLDDQCIGCQYCAMKCPYDVPQYSRARGIVRKCDMCSGRLAVGEAPACVQACPNEAIRITLVAHARVRGRYRELPALGGTRNGRTRLAGPKKTVRVPRLGTNPFLPDSPNPAITLPTTRYITRRALPAGLKSADADDVRRGKAHIPLTFMLVWTELGAGLALMDAFTGAALQSLRLAAVVATVMGLVAGALHLGQPLKAWRSFLGWRKSWLSRELIAFGIFLGALGSHLLLGRPLSGINAALAGLLAVACSAMVYVDTRRPFWNAPMTFGKFAGSTLLLGSCGTLLLSALGAASRVPQIPVIGLIMLGAAFKLAIEQRVFRRLETSGESSKGPRRPNRDSDKQPRGLANPQTGLARLMRGEQGPPVAALQKTALLLNGPLGPWSRVRVMCAIVGGILLPVTMLVGPMSIGLAALAFLVCLAGELIERHLFFVAEVAPKMPGSFGL